MLGRSWIVALAVLALIGVGYGGWALWSARGADELSVGWSSESPLCDGTAVRDPGSRRPVIEATEGMRCVITIRVTNGSGRTVRVVEAVAPMVGPRTGAVVTATNAEPARRGSEYDIDALLPLDRELDAGSTTNFDIVLVLRPAGCNEGGTLSVERWPSVTVEVLGRTHELRSDRTFAFHRKGETPGCSDL